MDMTSKIAPIIYSPLDLVSKLVELNEMIWCRGLVVNHVAGLKSSAKFNIRYLNEGDPIYYRKLYEDFC